MRNLIVSPAEAAAELLRRRQSKNKWRSYYPATGPLRRELYPKHLEFFNAGLKHPERLFLAANRVGKTEGAGAYETTLHLTGVYPDWWEGKRFDHPIKGWAAGDTSKTVRDIIQAKLLGQAGQHGTGMIPADLLVDTKAKQGLPDAVELIYVRHVSGGVSLLVLKSYDQKRISFQGTEQDLIWLDEEPPADVMAECVMRTMATGGFLGGMVMLTFTPLTGWTDVVDSFLNEEMRKAANRFYVQATWDDVPHLSEEEKSRLFAAMPLFQRDARSKGIPALGAGAIYPVPEDDFVIDDFPIPDHWPRSYGLDVGWNRTAAVWSAHDRDTQTVYLYSEYYRGQAEPSIHAQAIKSRGEWIPGAIDPAARGRGQVDGRQTVQMYRDLGLKLVEADNAVEAGIYDVWERMSGGRLKVLRSLRNWLEEWRQYRRDEKGHVVKAKDHLMDATRYDIRTGLALAVVKPKPVAVEQHNDGEYSWMA